MEEANKRESIAFAYTTGQGRYVRTDFVVESNGGWACPSRTGENCAGEWMSRRAFRLVECGVYNRVTVGGTSAASDLVEYFEQQFRGKQGRGPRWRIVDSVAFGR